MLIWSLDQNNPFVTKAHLHEKITKTLGARNPEPWLKHCNSDY